MANEDSIDRNNKQWNAHTADIVPHDNIHYGDSTYFIIIRIDAVQLLYTHVFAEPQTSYSKTIQLGILFTAGYTL
ncbi:unnamed protein product, partial [Rotaria socialis]